MLKHLLVVLAEDAVSFCHYESGRRRRGGPGLLSLDRLEAAVVFALKNNLKVNFLYPARKLGPAYDKLVESVDHVKIVPFAARSRYPDAILVVESGAVPPAAGLAGLRGANIILRVPRAGLPRLAADLKRLLPRAKRVNVVLTGVAGSGEAEYAAYRGQLEKIAPALLKLAKRPEPPELNVLTDRLVLDRMNNCQAGLSHLTVAPNGRLYLCPAFYYDDPADTLGEIRGQVDIANRRLLELKYAPICRICDAYQCRRCFFLNRALTLEFNTPSAEQCRLAHVEREASRAYLGRLREAGAGAGLADIPAVDYDDPFTVAVERKTAIADFKKL